MHGCLEMRILKQYWLSGEPDEPEDLCSHGLIFLKVDDVVVSDESDKDWGISESALALLRSTRYGHPHQYEDRIAEPYLIYHGCGAMLMMGCPISITWDAEHSQGEVNLSKFKKCPTTNEKDAIEYQGLQVSLALSCYAQQVYDFASQAKRLFQCVRRRVRNNELWEGEYEGFWKEYDELLAYADSVRSAKER